jgi:molecular chaperone HscA
MLQEGFAHADADMVARRLAEARVEAERMVLATAAALAADGELLEAGERGAIEELMQAVRTAAGSDDASAIDAAVEALAHGTEGFAAARMNRSIRSALAGRKVEEV